MDLGRIQMTRRIRHAVLASAACAAALGATALAGPDKIAFPKEYETWERYAVVDRYDNKQYRELYAKPEVVRAVRAGKPIPDGTVLAMAIYAAELDAQGNPVKDEKGRFRKGKQTGVSVMEKRAGWGSEYAPEVRNGNWEYGVFMPDGSPNAQANANTRPCFACHKPHEKQDFVISLARFSPTPAGGTAKPAAGVVAVADFTFGPEKFEGKVGQKVTWTNVDDSPHQVTLVSTDGKQGKRTGIMLRGQSESLTFDAAGVYNYICGLHPGMKGSIEVK
jgi:plastocyanin